MNDVESLLITAEASLKDALALLDQSGMSILLLVNKDGVLKQTVTDGDIRRLLLSGHDLNDKLNNLECINPVVGSADISQQDALALMDLHEVSQLPVVDNDNKPVGLFLRQNLHARIALSTPHIGDHERQYVEEAFSTNWIAPLGPNVDAFEDELANYVGSPHAAALSSGTAAIHLALRLLDVKQGDIVFCPSFTFVASANPILYQGATPVFIDSEPSTWNISPAALERALGQYTAQNKKPKAIIVVHLFGQSAQMKEIMALSTKFDVPIIEDAAESLGAFYQGKHTGTFGKFGIFSFNGNKIITTSGGGMLISEDKRLIEKARFLSTQARDTAPHYEHSEMGYNYRMSNVLAGIGRGQLKVIDDRVQSRREVFERYKNALKDIPGIEWMPEPEGDLSNRWLSVMHINPEKLESTPKNIIESLANLNIEARPVWKPMHLQPLFSNTPIFNHDEKDTFCEYLFNTSVCLPSASSMTRDEQDRVIDCIINTL